MSTERHPITPSRKLAQQWTDQIYGGPGAVVGSDDLCLAKLAAQWGADQELEACCHLLRLEGFDVVDDLRAARRPNPPSLKKQALEELEHVPVDPEGGITYSGLDLIRRALEALPDD